MVPLTQQGLKEILHYDMETGVFTWRKHRLRSREHSVAGTPFKGGYIRITIHRKPHMAHRLAWLYVTGSWPSCEMDHIDGDESNNAWANLREATRTQNNCNRGSHKNNRLGLKGVYQVHDNRFVARIYIDGRSTSLGSFKTAEEAHAAYCNAAQKHFGEFARAA